jgi:cysteine-S-conjugate beta-lyase
MTNSEFDQLSLSELRQRRSYKWQAFPPDVLPAFVAEMDFMLARPIESALAAAVTMGDTGYAWQIPELGEALSGFVRDRFAWEIDPADVALLPDVMSGVTEVLRVALKPGDGVVVNTPIYPPFFRHVLEAGCQVVEAPLEEGFGGYQLDLDAIERAFKSGARGYLLCNPHNPTGRVFARAELEVVAALAARYGVKVIADEIHAPLVLAGARHTSFLSLGDTAAEVGVVLISASKAWNIPGLKCAQLVVASDSMRSMVQRLPEGLASRAGNLGVIASIAAYRDSGPWLDELLEVLDRNRHLLRDLLAEHLPPVRMGPPQGGYLAWLDCRALRLGEEPVDFFLRRGRLALGPGPKFGASGVGHVRITMATTEAILREIVVRMRAAIR